MCWSCDHPGGDYLREVVQPTIALYGWMVQAVEGTPPWAYTVGLTERGVPELVVTGLSSDRAAVLLNQVATQWSGGIAGDQFMLDGRWLEIVDVPHPDAHLFTAVDVYGPGLRAQQLVWADEQGIWPWSSAHQRGRGGQPVLGPRAVHRASG